MLCGNVQLKTLMPRVAATLLPVTTYVITTAPLGPLLAEAVGYRGAVSDTDLADNHYRIVGGDRLMWSGRATVWPRNPRRYVRALTADIRKTYPQLGEVAVDYAWAGTLGNTVHRMPQIGELGPGVWLASGFGGHGLNTTAMAGNLIARAIVEGDQTWRQFTPFELVWAGGIFGCAAVQMRVWTRRLRDAIAERRARARDVAQRRAREAEIFFAGGGTSAKLRRGRRRRCTRHGSATGPGPGRTQDRSQIPCAAGFRHGRNGPAGGAATGPAEPVAAHKTARASQRVNAAALANAPGGGLPLAAEKSPLARKPPIGLLLAAMNKSATIGMQNPLAGASRFGPRIFWSMMMQL